MKNHGLAAVPVAVSAGVALVHTHVLLEQSILNPLEEGTVFGQHLAPVIFPDADPVTGGRIIARLLPEGRSRFAATSNNIGGALGVLYWHRPWKTRFEPTCSCSAPTPSPTS